MRTEPHGSVWSGGDAIYLARRQRDRGELHGRRNPGIVAWIEGTEFLRIGAEADGVCPDRHACRE